MSMYSKLACFAGGALFGSFGLKLLSTDDAKKACVHVAAVGLRAKDCIMENVTTAQENASDILAAAKDLNDERALRAAEDAIDAEIISDLEDFEAPSESDFEISTEEE